MKKFALIAFSAAFAFLFSCNTQTGSMSESNPTQEKNITADSTIGAAFRTGDAGKIDSVVAADFVDHTESGDKNRDSLKALIKMIHDNFPGMKMETVDHAVSGDYVYAWIKFSGNSNGAMGMPKGPFEFSSVELTKYKDGKAVEHWGFMDNRDVAKQREEMMKMMQSNMGGKMEGAKK